MSLATECRSYM